MTARAWQSLTMHAWCHSYVSPVEAENGLEWYAAYVLRLAAPPLTTAALCCRYALYLQYNQSLTTPAYKC